VNNLSEVKIRVYKAVNNNIACHRFHKGHAEVLKSYGIKKVTSASIEWFSDPSVYFIMVESKSGNEIYGGARFHVKNNTHKLPIEDALGKLDPKIYDLVGTGNQNKTGELCGLWNSKMMSGSGLSILLTRAVVARAGITMAGLLDLKSVYILCAPWTVQMVKNTGFRIEKSIGNEGTFIYPTPDLIATLLVVSDISTLKTAKPEDRSLIFDLRLHPRQKKLEKSSKGPIEVEYDLMLPDSMIHGKK